MTKKKGEYDTVRTERALYAAWSVVRANGLSSSSHETREEVKKFDQGLPRNIQRIARQLREGKFVFAHAKGLLLKKKSGGSRPVVVAPIPSRIVQRAILDVVQATPAISRDLKSGFNFGGVEGPTFGVPGAIAKALEVAQHSGYFIRTDIKSFFVDVPRDTAVRLIQAKIADERFNDLLKQATDTELRDMAKFGEDVRLFPLADGGVAQGSCLSPMLCNYLLKDFDRAMNDRGIVCIRYIDDFIIFGSDRKATFKAFKSGLTILRKLGLSAYDPESSDETERTKADHGPTSSGFQFLGCDVRRDRVRPAKKSKDKLIRDVKEIYSSALVAMRDPIFAIRTGSTYAEALVDASNKIRGWGNTYSFCTDDQLMLNIDLDLTKLFEEFNRSVKARLLKAGPGDKRRISGLWCLQDCKRDLGPDSTRAIIAKSAAND